jgi:hypothetical protein
LAEKEPQGWELEFKKEFVDWSIHHKGLCCFRDSLAMNHLQAFISTLLAKEREALIEKVREMGPKHIPIPCCDGAKKGIGWHTNLCRTETEDVDIIISQFHEVLDNLEKSL